MIKFVDLKIFCLTTVIFAALIFSGFSNAAAKKLYVTNAGNNTISIIDTAKNEIVNTIRVGVWPAGIAVDPAAIRAYVVNSSVGDSSVSVVDLLSNSILAKINVGKGPMHIALDTAAGIGYVTDAEDFVDGKNKSHTVTMIDLKTNKVTGSIDVGPGPFDIKIVNDTIFTSNSTEWVLAAISKKDNKVIKKVKVIDTPLGMAVSPDKTKLYVAIHGKGSVTVFDVKEIKELTTIKVGKAAWYIAIDQKKNKAYVTKS